MANNIWCDGACKGNPGPGGWGVYAKFEVAGEKSLHGGSALTTNNIMELQAMIESLKLVKQYGVATTIHVDSQYVQKGMLEWVSGWKRKGWKTAKGDPVKNKELWVELDALYLEVKSLITVAWVKGHSGDAGNDMADQLANEGCAPFLSA